SPPPRSSSPTSPGSPPSPSASPAMGPPGPRSSPGRSGTRCSGRVSSPRPRRTWSAASLYVAERDRSLAFLYGQDPDVANRGMQAWPLALLGHPGRARRRSQEALDRARALAHPYSLGYALVHSLCCHQYLLDAPAVIQEADEAIALATEKGFPNWLLAATILRGWALGQLGQPADGIAAITQAVALWRSTGAGPVVPYFLTLLADRHLAAGQLDPGLSALDEALEIATRHDELWCEPAIHRLRGRRLPAGGAAPGDVEACHRPSLPLARAGAARLLELHAAIDLADHWLDQGRTVEAAALLSGAYGTFTDGLDTPLLRQAR